MKPIEFELERTIRAPIHQVFARLVDLEGHNAWMSPTNPSDAGSRSSPMLKTRPPRVP